MAEAPWRQGAAPPGVSTRTKSDFSDHRPEPPLCVQNAMLTKDKKPFTYTPGGIDLSEIRSPRMAKRLERNAMSEGVTPSQQTPPGQHRAGPLPPSALAAMQPQLQVQVFPSGKVPQLPQHPHCGLPPPPPPPPPMKSSAPLPRDAFERPDMTKIIPDNPMALLRKTQGPVVKQDPILNKENYINNKTNDNFVQQRPAETRTNNSQVGSIYVPPVNQNAAPQTPPFVNQRDSPTSAVRPPPAFYKRQPSLTQNEPPSPPYVVQSKQPPNFESSAQNPDSPKPTLSKAPAPWLKQRSQSQEVPEWAVNEQKAPTAGVHNEDQTQLQKTKQQRPWSQKSIEKPDTEGWVTREQTKPEQQWQQNQVEPQYKPQRQSDIPTWQQRQAEPQNLQQKQPEPQHWQQRQADPQILQQRQPEPQQWQQKQSEPQHWQQKQPEPQHWQQRQPEPQSWRQQQPDTQPRQPTRPIQSSSVHIPQGSGVKQQIGNREVPQEYSPNEKVEVVIVNEPPQVFQHPGQTPRGGRQQQPQQSQGVRIIPVQIEGLASNGHSDQRLNRQLSWNSTPTQSNTFKVLQKITQTDGNDDEGDQTIIEHSPKTPHNFPQQNLHRMKQNQADQELVNKFKQEYSLNDYYENPRYRGGHIPSKLFWMLDESVPQEEAMNNRGPKVRTIPIQMEGDGPARPYVHPSEQIVSEPKKYMGSSIPSRSFKILQAMTAPDECGPGQSDL